MSILLKALKKSEAQRQVGKPPDIHATTDLSSGPDVPSQMWIPVVLLVLTAVSIAFMVARQYRLPVELTGSAVTVSNQVAPVDQEPGIPEPAGVGPTSTMEQVAMQADNPPEVSQFTPARDSEVESRKQRLTQSFTQYDAEPDPSEPSPGLRNEPSDPDGRNAEPMSPSDEVASSLKAMASTVEVIRAESQQREPSETRRRASRPETRSPEQSEPISFWQVPQTLRDSMPEFRITVLVYAEAPEDRFVLINGVRLMEKEELDAGLVLDEIRRDGAVFLFRNYRFLVKG